MNIPFYNFYFQSNIEEDLQILLIYEENNLQNEQFLSIPPFEQNFMDNFGFSPKQLIELLKIKGYLIEENFLFFLFDYQNSHYVYLGTNPLEENIWILFNEDVGKKVLFFYKFYNYSH